MRTYYIYNKVNEYKISIYKESKNLPTLLTGNFFHSLELFQITERVPSDTPLMFVATKDGKTVGQMFAALHHHKTFFPPFIYTHAHIHGEGIYYPGEDIDAIFPLLLHAATRYLRHTACLYIEFSDVSKKMFGYRHFRREGYFPVAWQEICNSLHSKAPEERISSKAMQQVCHERTKHVDCHEAKNEEEIKKFQRLYKNYYRLKPRRYVPPKEYFEEISKAEHAKLFITTKGNKVIGGCTCVFTNENAYLWHLASRRKRYALLHPDTLTVWYAIKYAQREGCRHIRFMDVGLPWKNNPLREFFLGFGGKPEAKLRWFRVSSRLFNRILKWVYKQ